MLYFFGLSPPVFTPNSENFAKSQGGTIPAQCIRNRTAEMTVSCSPDTCLTAKSHRSGTRVRRSYRPIRCANRKDRGAVSPFPARRYRDRGHEKSAPSYCSPHHKYRASGPEDTHSPVAPKIPPFSRATRHLRRPADLFSASATASSSHSSTSAGDCDTAALYFAEKLERDFYRRVKSEFLTPRSCCSSLFLASS